MDLNDSIMYNQAVTYALAGKREQAYDLFSHINLRNPNDSNLTFWRMFTAPTLQKAEGLFKMVRLNDPDNIILVEAEVWLNNRKYERPQPEGGFSRFPPRPVGTLANPFANNFKPEYIPRMALERGADMPPVMPMSTFASVSTMPVSSYQCPKCGSVVPPVTKRRTSKSGWVAFAILLILFFPLCWIGFVFQRESFQVCGHCNCELN